MLLTKEQCLSDKWNPQSSAIDLEDVHLRDAVYYAMQLYAKELSVGFANWVNTNNYIATPENTSPYHWYKESEDDDERWDEYFTVEQLFELFLQSINQK